MSTIASPQSDLAGLRVFVAEDEPLIAMVLEDALEMLGCTTLGPYSTLSEAVAAAGEADLDVALIDLNLRGEKAGPLIEVLKARGRRFAIVSGSPAEAGGHGESAVVTKPFTIDDIARALAEVSV